jgi:chromosome segregation ATPase
LILYGVLRIMYYVTLFHGVSMARAGIQFSDVKRAAEAIVARGGRPTIARVREVLGSGSSTTISGYLREWHASRGGEVDGKASSALEDHLSDAVHQLFLRIQTSARIELEREREQFKERVTEITASAAAANEQYAQASRALKTANDELERIRETVAGAQAAAHERLGQVRALEAAAEATAQHLADRAAEIHQLRQQVEVARAQFEHYTTETNKKMQDDAMANNARIAKLEEELRILDARERQAHAENVHLEAGLNTERSAHGSTKSDLISARASAQAAQSSLALAQGVNEQLEHQLSRKRSEHTAATEQITAVSREVQSLRELLAGRDVHIERLTAQLAQSEMRLDRLLSQHIPVSAPAGEGDGSAQDSLDATITAPPKQDD